MGPCMHDIYGQIRPHCPFKIDACLHDNHPLASDAGQPPVVRDRSSLDSSKPGLIWQMCTIHCGIYTA